MSNQESALNSLVSSIEKLQEHQKVLAKHTTGMKRQLDDLTKQFNNRPELQQLISLQNTLAQLPMQLDERSPFPYQFANSITLFARSNTIPRPTGIVNALTFWAIAAIARGTLNGCLT